MPGAGFALFDLTLGRPPRTSAPRRWRGRGFSHDRDRSTAETELFCHRRAALGIRGCRQRMIRRQLPARPIRGNIEAVPQPKVAAQGLGAKPTFETDNMILLHRAPDRHRRLRPLLHWRGAPETGQCAMHLNDKCSEPVGRDLVMSHIAADDAHNLIEIDLRP